MTVFFTRSGFAVFEAVGEEIDQSLAIVFETALNSKRANFPLKS